MPDVLAIVSKAVFEKAAPAAKLGAVLPMRVYRSASKHLEKLTAGGRLFLVTVRPTGEALWLVAVLENPQFDGEEWRSEKNKRPLTDISALKDRIRFESGKGIQAAQGALGMSLQTPRVLTAADADLILAAAPAAAPKAPRPPRPPGPANVAKHHAQAPLPCLCRGCLADAPESVVVDETTYVRAKVEVNERCLWFWLPADVQDQLADIQQTLQERVAARFKPWVKGKGRKAAASAGEDDDCDDE